MSRYWYFLKNYPKENADISADILLASFNNSVKKSNFPSSSKNTNVTPVFRKVDRNFKDNYRPISVLPKMSKLFDRCIFCQLYSFMFELLSKYHCLSTYGFFQAVIFALNFLKGNRYLSRTSPSFFLCVLVLSKKGRLGSELALITKELI